MHVCVLTTLYIILVFLFIMRVLSKSCLSSLSIKGFFRKPTSPPLNLKFFLKSTRPSFLIKLAALGNLKVNFHCAHWHSFFPLKKGLSKTHQSSLTLKGGSTAFPKPLFSWRRLAALGNLKVNFHCAHLHNLSPQGTGEVPTALLVLFSKINPSFFTIKEGSFENPPVLPYP